MKPRVVCARGCSIGRRRRFCGADLDSAHEFEKVIKITYLSFVEMTSDASKALFHTQLEDVCDQFGIAKHEAFPRWICQNILGIADEGVIDEAVSIGGKADYGIDIFHADEGGDATEQYICWAQAKFSETLDHVVTREEMESFAGTLGHLRDCPSGANKTFRQKSAEFAKIEAKSPHIQKRLIFAVTGRINDQVRDLIGSDRWKKDRLGTGSNVRLEILDLDRILSRMVVPHTPALTIRFDGDVIERSDETTGKKSIIGYASASSLVRLAKDHRETLFLENPRQAIGRTAPTHKAILNTLSRDDTRKKFWKLNNGITAICTAFNTADELATYRVENFKIVNGRQTVYTLEDSAHPIDDVFLFMTIHEAVDDGERNLISEATNTQNPIKPVDLVTNYPEMTEMVLQCRREFPDFYFERQTNGFESAKRSTQQRVTRRRNMEKSTTARAYYAYAISPADAIMPDRELFSGTGEPNHYELVFRDRNIRDLIIPHIFMQMLTELHRRWCGQLRDDPTDKTARDKGIISKNVVKYFILRFIYESMMGMDESAREGVKDKMIRKFRELKKGDAMPDAFLGIAEAAYQTFMLCFDMDRNETWPQSLLERIKSDKYTEQEQDVPDSYDIMTVLKQRGNRLLPHMLRMREHAIRMNGDQVGAKLLELGSY